MTVCKVFLLDCGETKYGDAVLIQVDKTAILIDGAHRADVGPVGTHPGLTAQLADRLGQDPKKLHVELLVVTHAHDDHIGCLPELVAAGLTADRALVVDPDFGWGRAIDDDAGPRGADPRTREVLAGLREEPWRGDEPGLDEFLADAAGLEDRYRGMLKQLAKNKPKTKIVRHGRDSAKALVKAMADAGVTLRILGPSQAQLVATSAQLRSDSDGWAGDLDTIFAADAALTAADVYRRIIGEIDSDARLGHMVNGQSIVLEIEAGGKRLLLTGDMQLAKPQTSDKTIKAEIAALIQRIEKFQPYDFVKLSHHGSWNGFDDTLIDALAPAVVGICAGENSTSHPSREMLGWLKDRRDHLTWARTDRQGAVAIDLSDADPVFDPKTGLNDARPNDGGDQPVTTTIVPVPPQPPVRAPEPPPELGTYAPPEPTVSPVLVERTDGNTVEITARIPIRNVKVNLSIEVVAPDGPTTTAPAIGTGRPHGDEQAPASSTGESGTTRVGGGRRLPPLMFVTNRRRLADRIKPDGANAAIAALRAVPGAVVVDDADGSAEDIRKRIAPLRGATRGVVLVGGYDVVPSQVVDALPADIRKRVTDFDDKDDFVVWSDDVYGAIDEDAIPDVPVSRVPDCGDARFLLRALGTTAPTPRTRTGIHNMRRPFAAKVWRDDMPAIGGAAEPEASLPRGRPRVAALAPGDALYLMLHGEARNGVRFLGEDETGDVVEAVNLEALPAAWQGTVFAGCCWGALPVEVPAADHGPGDRVVSRTPANSLALAFLDRGAAAFIGCTGSHYSPTEPPYDYFGKPMHSAFWRAIGAGRRPAEALWSAKQDFVRDLPHKLPNNRRTPAGIAIEFKTWRQFTCLGLGW